MSKPKYIIIEMPTPLELAEEVSKHMESVSVKYTEDGNDFERVENYDPHGSVICHPSSPSDPQRPFRFSQPMRLRVQFTRSFGPFGPFGGTLADNLPQGRAGVPMEERAAALGQSIKERETALLSQQEPSKDTPPEKQSEPKPPADNVQ